jgi:hypothetical protein
VPQARRSDSKSTSRAKATSSAKSTGRGRPKRTTAGSSAATTPAPASGGRRARSANSASGARSAKAKASAGSPEARLEATAARLRKLNERIIDVGKQTGEHTLVSYEKALKAMASAVERGPGSSDIDWISHLATTQAKFIRDVTQAWTAAARDMLK